MSVRIITDSTADLRPGVKVQVVPLSIHFGEESYLDGVELGHREFYEKLIEGPVLPTTSQPSPYDFSKCYQEAQEAGQEVIVITLSQKLSGTYQSATIAAEDFPGMVHVVDSQSVAIGEGILVEYAVQLANQGLSAAEILPKIQEARGRVVVMALLDTLEYLKRGGRISKTTALAGSLLSIKPVASLENGEIVLLGKARGSKQGNNLMIQKMNAAGGVDFTMPALLGYTGLSDALLQKYIEDSASLWEGHYTRENIPIAYIGGTIGTHAGPGAIAVAFFKPKGNH